MPSRKVISTEDQTKYESKFDLNVMFEFSNIINSSLDLNFILGHLLLTIMGKLLFLRGIVLLRTSESLFRVENIKGISGPLLGTEIAIAKIPHRIVYTEKEDGRKHTWLQFFRDRGIGVIFPLIARGKVLGIAGFASSVTKQKLGEKEEIYIKSLSNIAAGAIEKSIVIEELKHVNRRLDGKFQELNTLFELSKEFNAVLDAERLIKLLMFSVMGQIGAAKHFLYLERNGSFQTVSIRLDKQLTPALTSFFPQVSLPTLVENLIRKHERQYKEVLDDLGVRVLIPLQIQNETKGILGLGDKIRGEKYLQTDLEFLSSLGNQAMISLENARLFKEAIEKQKLEDDLVIAKEIQQGLLPKKLPQIPRLDVAAINISSKHVGGDYYDVISIGSNKFVLAIGDVSGKGTPASLLMANLQATIRALVPLDLPLSELTGRVNDLLCDNTSSGRFITFFWAMIDTDKHCIRYVSAGHNSPYLFRANGTIERLDKGGIILGIMKTVLPYDEGEVSMSTGDVLVLFTDGVSEAMNIKGEELGEQRIEEICTTSLSDSSHVILSKIVDAVKLHSANTLQSDDITLVVAKAFD